MIPAQELCLEALRTGIVSPIVRLTTPTAGTAQNILSHVGGGHITLGTSDCKSLICKSKKHSGGISMKRLWQWSQDMAVPALKILLQADGLVGSLPEVCEVV